MRNELIIDGENYITMRKNLSTLDEANKIKLQYESQIKNTKFITYYDANSDTYAVLMRGKVHKEWSSKLF